MILVIVALSPVVVFWVYENWERERGIETAEAERVVAIALAMADDVSSRIHELDAHAEALARALGPRPLVAENCLPDFAEEQVRLLHRNGLWARDREGRLVCGKPPEIDGKRIDLPRPGFEAWGIGHPLLSVPDPATGMRLIAFERPLTDSGNRIVGSVGGGIDFMQRGDLVARYGLGDEADEYRLALVDRETEIAKIFRSGGPMWRVATIAAFDAKERVYAAVPVSDAPFVAVVGLTTDVIREEAAERQIRWVLVLVVWLAMSFAAAIWFSRRIVEPIAAIARSVVEAGSGRVGERLATRVKTNIAEFLLVAHQFDEMMENIERDRRELQESAGRYSLLFREMISGFALHEIILDDAGEPCDYRFLAVNPAFEAQTGLRAADIVGKTVREVMPSIEEYWIRRYGRVALTGEPDEFQNFTAALDRYYEVRAYRPRPGQFAVLFHDVSVRIRAERELERLAERITLATRAAGIGIWELDTATGRIDCDDQMRRLYGYPADSRGWKIEEWAAAFHPEDAERVRREYESALAGEREFGSEYRVVRADGATRTLRSTGVVRRDDGGRPVRMLGASWDVTDYREALTRLEEAKEAAEAANLAKNRFLQTMSHELRTPLNAIQGFAQLMLSREIDPLKVEYLEIIDRASKNLHGMIEDILQLTQIDAGRFSVAAEPFVLAREVDTLGRMFGPECAEKGLSYIQVIAPDVPLTLVGDARVLRQILVNLIGNAAKFTHRGTVELSIRRASADETSAGCVRLDFSVTDTGIGISPASQERIFEIFEQEDNSMTRRYGGPGLGLAISKRLVARLGGEIGVESHPGRGSRFHFTATFEIAELAYPDDDAVTRRDAGSGGKRILVVEDDVFSRQLLDAILSEKNYEIVFATDGVVALERLKKGGIDLVLLDIQLPRINGIEVTRRVRSGAVEGCDPNLPIIAVTAYAMASDEETFRAEGMNAFVSKPIEPARIVAMIDEFFTCGGERR